MSAWKGTDYNERVFNRARAGLVGVYLDGVAGVSPDQGRTMVSPEAADRHIAHGRTSYAELVAQKPPRQMKIWLDAKIKELDGLIAKAVAVREGRSPQRMTRADYAANQAALAHDARERMARIDRERR